MITEIEARLIEPKNKKGEPTYPAFIAVKLMKDGKVLDTIPYGNGVRETEAELHSSFCVPVECVDDLIILMQGLKNENE